MEILSTLSTIVAWVMGIIVLVKLFQNEGVLKGILGLICMLYTFIWGWMKNKELGITNVMYVWTAVIVVSIIINLLFPAQMPTAGAFVP
jgi:hypothetical protein